MTKKNIYLGDNKANKSASDIKGELVNFDNEVYYKISNSNTMRPFFMSLISNSNHWMFISSNGGLTAGRKNAEHSLFPYYTDDKITESAEITGNKTIVQVHQGDKTLLWEPFSSKYQGIYDITQNLYKNKYGNKVVFEEINNDLGLSFIYQWNTSDEFGFVKKSKISNHSSANVAITILDGLQNVLPASITSDLQNSRSNLVDAYKRNELQKDAGIGIIALSAVIVDKAEPSEALKSNIVWSYGTKNPTYLMSSLQLNAFRNGEEIEEETDVKAEKGAYFTIQELTLSAEESKEWLFVTEVNQTISDIKKIAAKINSDANLIEEIQKDINTGTKNLIQLAGASDGIQLSNNKLRNTRHFANTLFNIMRGGIFDNNYQVEKQDFINYLKQANKQVALALDEVVNALPETFTKIYLKELAENTNDKDFKRLSFEYLPLKFSRRHGDPSRPWNKFSINTRSEVDGSKILDYEGNWRDIFQNWEALAHSYPDFIEGMIYKFLNATTFEGYNPYRVTKDGFDWEIIEENDPWSYIGYWGDHQIIYLLKFLEFIEAHYPGKLATSFTEEIFVYANVPYKIKSYEDTLKNPKDTIDFDYRLNEEIEEERAKIGVDGALLKDAHQEIYKVNLIEKLLATVLAKVSNFIPEGGIWLNTQRPEWNDANNALVGNGVSMVTLYYLQRFLNFFEEIVSKSDLDSVSISDELVAFFNQVVKTLEENKAILEGKVSNKDRKTVLDGLGKAGSTYRTSVYKEAFKNKKSALSKSDLLAFLTVTKSYLEHAIQANKRTDNLYHAYNLMTVENDNEVSISYLPEMLEGQVAALSAGYLKANEALVLLDALKASALFRADQYSYILYPNKDLPRFNKKNNIPAASVQKSTLLQQLIADGNTQVLEQDVNEECHFNGNFNNAGSLKQAIDNLPAKYQSLVAKERQLVLDVFEELFDHKSFTGRSGTFFGYEGLGSIYWHMVSKLLLAVQENCLLAVNNGENEEVIGRLLEHYYEINEGIGVHKSPELYGAFPTDPYSHTPAGKGAQQPGMTGQVKEDVLCRFGELGVFVKEGKLQFNPRLLRGQEFLEAASEFSYTDVHQEPKKITVPKDSVCFTYCQIPVVYHLSTENKITVVQKDNSEITFNALSLDTETSKLVFERSGSVTQLNVFLKK